MDNPSVAYSDIPPTFLYAESIFSNLCFYVQSIVDIDSIVCILVTRYADLILLQIPPSSFSSAENFQRRLITNIFENEGAFAN